MHICFSDVQVNLGMTVSPTGLEKILHFLEYQSVHIFDILVNAVDCPQSIFSSLQALALPLHKLCASSDARLFSLPLSLPQGLCIDLTVISFQWLLVGQGPRA